MAEATGSFKKKQKAIIDRLVMLLEEKGMTQRDLAIKASMKDSVISRILNGDANLTLKTIATIELALEDDLICIPMRLSEAKS